MTLFVQILTFLISIGIIWFFAGLLIESVTRIARRFCKTGFITAFFILGTLTSISEFSVAVHATADGVPGVSVGNLIGGVVVVLLFIVPMLAIAGKGIAVNEAVSRRGLLLILAAVALPALLILDGDITRGEGLIALLSYAVIAYVLYRERKAINACDVREEAVRYGVGSLLADGGRILLGSVAIFLAAHVLVEQAVFFAQELRVAPSLIGLLMLSVGTNVPEIAVAVRAILSGRADVAFGDYLGSAAMNTFIFGLVAIANGTFFIEAKSFMPTVAIIVVGFAALYLFVRKKSILSRRAGAVLLLFYALFLLIQIGEMF